MKLLKKVIVFILLSLLLTSCGNKVIEEKEKIDLNINDLRIGTLLGSSQSTLFLNKFPEIDFQEFNTITEGILALKSNKIDAFACADSIGALIINNNEDLKAEVFTEEYEDTGFVFSKGNEDLIVEFNTFLKEIKNSGKLDEIINKWIKDYREDIIYTPPVYKKDKRILKVIASDTIAPFTYSYGGELIGMSREIFDLFASTYGYGVELTVSNFDGVLAGVSYGKYDLAIGDISMTEERKKNLDFSDSVYTEHHVIITLNDNIQSENVYKTIDELNGKKMGCMSGSIFSEFIERILPDSQIIYFNNRDELLLALRQDKICGYLADKPVGLVNCYQNPDIGYIDYDLEEIQYGVCFPKDSSLKDQYNEYLRKINNNGKIIELQEKWIKQNGIEEHYEIPKLEGKNGTVKICTTVDAAPFVFYKNNQYEGYEVELAYGFAQEYGYDIEIESTNFGSLIPAIAAGRFDMSFNGIYITDERKKSVDFSDPDYISNAVAIVKKDVEIENKSFFETLKEKFISTFIVEDRYLMILNGIGITLLISVASTFIGTLLGVILYLLSRKNNYIKKFFNAIYYFLSGLPIVVLLMIMFYIVFARSSLSGTVVSIICFSIMFGGTTYSLLNTGINAIDKGQLEAGLALGYTENKTLFKFILPQALRIVMPTYNSEVVSLVKSSSIVGYITVQDITRVSDMIRSRTYDAFFPLIVTAIIYFVLSHNLNKLINYLQKRFLPSEKSKEEILRSFKQRKSGE